MPGTGPCTFGTCGWRLCRVELTVLVTHGRDDEACYRDYVRVVP
jgi:hypothetical protein